jgi:hypothetical protein
MSILKKLLHKCSYQLGGKKVTTTSTSPISPVLPKTTDKSEDFIPNVKMQPYVKGNIKDFIMPIPNAKPSNGKSLFVPLPNADPNEKPVMQLLPKKYGIDELPVIYGQFMNVKYYEFNDNNSEIIDTIKGDSFEYLEKEIDNIYINNEKVKINELLETLNEQEKEVII